MHWAGWLFVGGLLAGLLLLVAGLASAVADPIQRQARVVIDGLEPGSPPIRIALLSDIHIGNRGMSAERLERIVAQINAARTDAVVLAGDFVNGNRPDDPRAKPELLTVPLRGLKAPLGVFAMLGNHDHWIGADRVAEALGKANVRLLENDAVRAGPLAIVGLGDRYSGHDDLPAALARARELGGIPVVATHSPDLAPELPLGVQAVLAGHSHCGQIVLPLIGSLPEFLGYRLFDPRYRCGLVREASRTVIVTAGLGTGGVPVRLGAPPDWWLVTIVPR